MAQVKGGAIGQVEALADALGVDPDSITCEVVELEGDTIDEIAEQMRARGATEEQIDEVVESLIADEMLEGER